MSRQRAILLVEDNPDDVELTLRALERSSDPPEVTVVADGEQALRWLLPDWADASHCAPALPDLVLLDLNLPKIDGLELLSRLRSHRRTRRLPVVVLSSSNAEGDLRSSYDRGANSFIRKPVDYEEFAQVARSLSRYWLALNEPPPPEPPDRHGAAGHAY